MSSKVFAPNVHLFAFHLRTRSASDGGEAADRPLLWHECDRILEKLQIPNFQLKAQLNLSQDTDSTCVDLVAAAEENNVSLAFEGKVDLDGEVANITGFAYPQRIRDSYGLALNIGRPEQENGEKTSAVDVGLLGQFNLDNCLMLEVNERSLGQTLLITAGLSEQQQQQDWQFLKNLADQCLQALIPEPESRPEFNRDGQLFGSPIFEYGTSASIASYRHIIVWLFPNEASPTIFYNYYNDFVELFYYRNKVTRAYQLGKNVSRLIYQDSQRIEQYVNQVFQQLPADGRPLSNPELKDFKIRLKTMPKLAIEYSRLLRDLEYYRYTIASNAQNYVEELQQLERALQPNYAKFGNINLTFLERFSHQDVRQILEQLQADLGYFVYTNGLVDKAIAGIRGIIEIEQAESDRRLLSFMRSKKVTDENNDRNWQTKVQENEVAKKERDRALQNIILVLGTSLGVGAIVASSKAGLPLSILAALLVGAAIGWFAYLIQQKG